MAMNRIHGRAIDPHELTQHIQRLLRRSGVADGYGRHRSHPPELPKCLKVGLCVSGGPDSMSMAYLLKNMPMIENVRIEPQAMIVDHKAREGSTEEAATVMRFLKDIGIPATILTMIWPTETVPLSLTNFESRARTQRYRLIAQHSLKHDIRHLFLGHHQDDQVETVMMRMIRQESPSLLGLQGMSVESPIPCCDDIYGAHESVTTVENLSNMPHNRKASVTVASGTDIELPMPVGLLLHRPLLNFCKADLVATCEKNDVKFVIDTTNKNPRNNTRNAVRFLRNQYQLPKALWAPRVLSLQHHADRVTKQILHGGSHYLEGIDIKSLDQRTGVLKFKTPKIDDDKPEPTQILSNALSRLLEMVTPCARSDQALQVPLNVLSAMYPEHELRPKNETTGDRRCEHVGKPVNSHRVLLQPALTEARVWTLSRQPMRETEADLNTWHFGADTEHSPQKEGQPPWRLWDNRFWLQVYTADSRHLKDIGVRPYSPDITAHLREQDRKILKKAAPGKIRTSLPVLTYKDQAFALPSFNFILNDPVSTFGISISWKVRYKTIDRLSELTIGQLHDI